MTLRSWPAGVEGEARIELDLLGPSIRVVATCRVAVRGNPCRGRLRRRAPVLRPISTTTITDSRRGRAGEENLS